MSRVVVTGGAGFLGSHLCRKLLDRGDTVVAVDNLVTGNLDNLDGFSAHPEFIFVPSDVSNFLHVPGPVDAGASADDIAGVVAMLCSEAGGYVSGATIDVNGGWYFGP